MSAHRRGYTRQWNRERLRYLSEHRWCVDCDKEGLQVEATVVDHVVPHKGDDRLFWDVSNWAPRCASHHNRKTAGERQPWW